MSQGHKTLAMRMLDTLIEQGTWQSREELQAQHRCSAVALEDALADLVTEGRADYRANVGYRAAGTPLCRKALQMAYRERQRNPRQRRFMTPNYFSEDLVRFGFAQVEQVAGAETLIAYELVLDRAKVDGESINDQAANLIAIAEKFLLGGLEHAGTGV